jgi:FKBP-type peptidyl-prolyl cis-trans isomerase SlyD
MADIINKYISVQYKLYTVDEKGEHLVEQTTHERPFNFISGFGFALEAFENNVKDLEKGKTFTFQLSPEEAYGEYVEARVIELEREIFIINGEFDKEHIYKGAVIPLQNEDGNHFLGRVLEIGDDKVKVDLNHPLAGKDLCFKGSIVENREPREAEIQQLIKMMSGECDCGCGDCGGHEHGDGCNCGGCH